MSDTEEGAKRVKLTLKQLLFVDAYIGEARGNASKAYKIAGNEGTDGAIRVSASRMLTNANVLAEINRRLTERSLTGSQVLDRLTEHANASIEPFLRIVGDEVKMDLSQETAKGHLHLIKKAKTKRRSGGSQENPWEEIETEIELHDPQSALALLGRYHKLFSERSVSITRPTEDGKGTVTATADSLDEARLLTLHNDLLAKALMDAGVELDDELKPPNMTASNGADEVETVDE